MKILAFGKGFCLARPWAELNISFIIILFLLGIVLHISSTQIYLMELLEHIKDPIPSKVRLFLDFEGDQPLPDHLISENVTIDRLYMETSVISSSLSEEELKSLPVLSQCDSISTMEIPIK